MLYQFHPQLFCLYKAGKLRLWRRAATKGSLAENDLFSSKELVELGLPGETHLSLNTEFDRKESDMCYGGGGGSVECVSSCGTG